MAVTIIDINKFLTELGSFPIIDVRSPSEFKHAHIPGAYNLSLFNDDERKVVGTAYKQQSRETAIKIGLQFFAPKMVKMIEEIEQLTGSNNGAVKPAITNGFNNRNIVIHCWRGGMRSAGVAWLLDLYGFKVFTLRGGYKSFRQWCHRQFIVNYECKVVGGYTGSGKTGVISELQRQRKPAIDLEGLANHRGSSFGSIGMPEQPTQEMFENLLALELHKLQKQRIEQDMLDEANESAGFIGQNKQADNTAVPFEVWLEDESQRIGNLNIPVEFWNQMRAAQVYFLDIPFEKRLEWLVKDYGKGDKEKIMNAILRIKKRLGGLETKTAINHLLEDDLLECFRVLLTYYDKYYLKGLQGREDWQQKTIYVPSAEVNAFENTRKILNTVTAEQIAPIDSGT